MGIGSGGVRQWNGPIYPLITRDPVSGGELVVSRLECPESGVVIEGVFSLGWLARLTPEQLEFARLMLVNRGNVQKVAAELGVAYNTARNRLDDIVAALGGPSDAEARADARAARQAVLDRLAAGEIERRGGDAPPPATIAGGWVSSGDGGRRLKPRLGGLRPRNPACAGFPCPTRSVDRQPDPCPAATRAGGFRGRQAPEARFQPPAPSPAAPLRRSPLRAIAC